MPVDKNHRSRPGAARATSVSSEEMLPRHGEGNPDLQDELLMMEVSLLRAFQAHQRMKSTTKDKIVSALRSRS
jgi:hypothetical protein